jgi:two-component system response regulator RstA
MFAIHSRVAEHSEPSRILLLEPDASLATSIVACLTRHGCAVLRETDGVCAVTRARELRPDALVVDTALGGIDGFGVCCELRASGYQGPIIMTSWREDDIDHVLGLEMGADQFLCKPVSPRILLAHIKAVLRRRDVRQRISRREARLEFGDFIIDQSRREVCVGDSSVQLRGRDFEVLWLLANNAGHILTRRRIAEALGKAAISVRDRFVDNRIYRIRRELRDSEQENQRIRSVRGIGYMFCHHPSLASLPGRRDASIQQLSDMTK